MQKATQKDIQISQRINQLKASATLLLGARTKELKSRGEDVISLSLGEPDWDSFQVAKRAGIEAIEQNLTRYTPAKGDPSLCEAIAQNVNQQLGTQYSEQDVTVSTGGKMILFSAMQSVINPGDEVIVPAPYWVSYPSQVQLAGGMVKAVATYEKDGFKLRADILRAAITPRTRMLILNSPSNPTGLFYSAAELKALGSVLKEHPEVLVVSDDLYNQLVFDDRLVVSPHILQACPELVRQVLVVNGASKVYAMTGWRVGWALGPRPLVQAMSKFQSQSVSCASSVSQAATLVAIKQGGADIARTRVELRKRRDLVVELLGSVPEFSFHPPQGAFYIWINIQKCLGKSLKTGELVETSGKFCEYLLRDQLVAAVPGEEFGMEGYVRLSYIVPEQDLLRAIERIKDFLSCLAPRAAVEAHSKLRGHSAP